uniref:Uncharacterized protein n=1 Tax=Arundo donax TaxID=35708 RepID=A0A0A8Y9L7_ARUDO
MNACKQVNTKNKDTIEILQLLLPDH